jgi:hypothetical protein
MSASWACRRVSELRVIKTAFAPICLAASMTVGYSPRKASVSTPVIGGSIEPLYRGPSTESRLIRNTDKSKGLAYSSAKHRFSTNN